MGQIASAFGRARAGAARTAAVALLIALIASLTACTGSSDGSKDSGAASAGSTTADPGAAAPSLAPAGSSSASTPAATVTPKPAATSRGRAPSGGGINQTVPSRQLTTKAPVALTSAASFGGRVTAKISDITAIRATGRGAGEVSGPALRVTFVVTNGSTSAVGLDAVTADLTDSAGDPTVSMIGSPADPFRGSVAAGASRRGVYVFAVAANRRTPVTISLNYSASSPVVLFKGNAS